MRRAASALVLVLMLLQQVSADAAPTIEIQESVMSAQQPGDTSYHVTFVASEQPDQWVCMTSVPDPTWLPLVTATSFAPSPTWSRRLDSFYFDNTQQVQVLVQRPTRPGLYSINCAARYFARGLEVSAVWQLRVNDPRLKHELRLPLVVK